MSVKELYASTTAIHYTSIHDSTYIGGWGNVLDISLSFTDIDLYSSFLRSNTKPCKLYTYYIPLAFSYTQNYWSVVNPSSFAKQSLQTHILLPASSHLLSSHIVACIYPSTDTIEWNMYCISHVSLLPTRSSVKLRLIVSSAASCCAVSAIFQ